MFDVEGVLEPFERATPLPREAFVVPASLDLEERAIFASSWVPVAHVADLVRPGDWVRAPLRDEHVIVLRGADLELAALVAVCSHRGTLLCEGDRGHLRGLELRCPYHGWRFATDGAVLASPGAKDGPRLQRIPIHVHAGVVFVSFEPPAFAVPPWLEGLPPLERVRRTDHEVRANWKVLVGNFQESHHFPTVHPGLEGRTPWSASSSITTHDAWLGGTMDLLPGFETVSMSGQLRGRPVIAQGRRVLDALVFPLWLTSLQPDYLLTYRLAPIAVNRTLVTAEVHVHPTARSGDLEDVFTFWDRTNEEDRAICERQQAGLAARHAPRTTYASSEDGLHAFERLVATRYLRAP